MEPLYVPQHLSLEEYTSMQGEQQHV